jgi:hypothetical protein
MNRLVVTFPQELYPVNPSGSSLSAGNTNSSSRFHFEVRHFFDPIGCRSIQTAPCVNSKGDDKNLLLLSEVYNLSFKVKLQHLFGQPQSELGEKHCQ